MSEVVHMLTDKECSIPSPKQPPFLNASVLNSDVSRTFMNSLLQTKEGESLKSANTASSESKCTETIEASEPR